MELQPIGCNPKKQTKACMDYPARIPQQLSTILPAFRKQAGLTQAQLAAQLNVTQQTVSDLERNAANVSVGRLMTLLNLLGVELVLRERPPQRDPNEINPKTGMPFW